MIYNKSVTQSQTTATNSVHLLLRSRIDCVSINISIIGKLLEICKFESKKFLHALCTMNRYMKLKLRELIFVSL